MTSQSQYLISRIKEALYNASGNKAKAMQQIIAWSAADHQLLQALTRSHLSGIVAYHVDRVTSGAIETNQAPQTNHAPNQIGSIPKAQPRQPVPGQGQEQGNAFGEALFQAASNQKTAQFGLEGHATATPREENASQRHIDAMRHIASFSSHSSDKR